MTSRSHTPSIDRATGIAIVVTLAALAVLFARGGSVLDAALVVAVAVAWMRAPARAAGAPDAARVAVANGGERARAGGVDSRASDEDPVEVGADAADESGKAEAVEPKTVGSPASAPAVDASALRALTGVINAVHAASLDVEAGLSQGRVLVQESIADLSSSFDSLKTDTSQQQELVQDLVTQIAAQHRFDETDVAEVGLFRHYMLETRNLLTEFVDHIVTVSRESMAMVSRVGEINEQMNEVEKVTKLVIKLASQTSLLALNAKIEAAHAGERGRGFAIVADEVKGLAAESHEFNDQISQLVNIARATVEKAKTRISELASQDMTTAIESKGKVEIMFGEVEQMNDELEHQIERVSAQTERVGAAVNDAVRCLQFEDIVTQVLDQTSAVLARVTEFSEDLLGLLRQDSLAGVGADELAGHITERIARFELDISQTHKPALQEDMGEGEVELF